MKQDKEWVTHYKLPMKKMAILINRQSNLVSTERKFSNSCKLLLKEIEDLLNIYHVMQVNPEKHDKVNAEAEKHLLISW